MRVIQVSKNFTGARANLIHCDPDELVLMVDVDRCISCGSCLLACQQESGGPDRQLPSGTIEISAAVSGGEPLQLKLPNACRVCDNPCEYYSEYNFWTTCPASQGTVGDGLPCNQCLTRIEQGFMPACATRCSMKCIYFGRARDVAFTLGEKRLRDMGDIEFGVVERIA